MEIDKKLDAGVLMVQTLSKAIRQSTNNYTRTKDGVKFDAEAVTDDVLFFHYTIPEMLEKLHKLSKEKADSLKELAEGLKVVPFDLRNEIKQYTILAEESQDWDMEESKYIIE